MTSEKTPSTEVVRSWAAFVPVTSVGMRWSEKDAAAFDRWLAEHDAQLIEGLAGDMNRLSGGHQELWLFEQAQARRRQGRRRRR